MIEIPRRSSRPSWPTRARWAVIMLVFAAGLATGLVGCPKQALLMDTEWVRTQPAPDDVRLPIEQALAAYAAGDMANALALLTAALSRTQDPEVRAFVGLQMGMIHLRLGSRAAAREAVAGVICSGMEAFAARARVLDALALVGLGKNAEASPVLAGVDPAAAAKVTDDPVLVSDILVAAGRIALAAMDWTAAAQRFASAMQKAGVDPASMAKAASLLAEIEASIALMPASTPPPPSHADLLSAIPEGGPFWALLMASAGQDALSSWDVSKAESMAASIEAKGFAAAAAPLRKAIEEARQEIALTDSTTVGALLPLTGKNSEIGRMMKEGIETALRIVSLEHPMKVVFLDTADDPDLARSHVRVLKKELRAIAAIGPATGATAVAAAAEASDIGMPMITLTLKPGVTAAGPWVFRNFTTWKAEVDALASHAVKTCGISRFAVLYPDSSYGKGMAGSFGAAVAAMGGDVVLDLSFASSETNFIEIAKKVRANPGVQAVFVPAPAQTLALVAPALAYEDVWSSTTAEVLAPTPPAGGKPAKMRVLVLAPQVAYSADLPDKAGKYLEGAVFATGFHVVEGDQLASLFVDEIGKIHPGEVGIYHSYAADAFLVVAAAVSRGGVKTRGQLRDWLAARAGVEVQVETVGSFGGFAADREPLDPLDLVVISGGAYAGTN